MYISRMVISIVVTYSVLCAQPPERNFMVAVKAGDEQRVRQKLTENKNFASISDRQSGRTPLMWAVINGHEAIVNALQDAGADRDVRARNGKTALSFAVQKLFGTDTSYKTYQRIINALGYVLMGPVNQFFPHRDSVLIAGAYPGAIAEGYVFLDLWANESFTASSFGELARDIEEGDRIITALIGQPEKERQIGEERDEEAAFEDQDSDEEVHEQEVENGDDKEGAQRYSVYFFDAASIHQWWQRQSGGRWHNPITNTVTEVGNVMQYVLAVHSPSKIITAYYVGTGVYTAVHPYRAGDVRLFFQAINEGNGAEVERLLRKGIDVNVRDQNHTALMRAVRFAQPDIVKRLLSDSDIDVNARGPYGYTALMESIDSVRLHLRDLQKYQRYLEVIRVLLNDSRIDRAKQNSEQKTTRDLAETYKLNDVLDLFDATASTTQ